MSDAAVPVAYQGAPGAFSEDAITAFFAGRETIRAAQREFHDVRTAVLSGAARFGVLPIENSIHGAVTASLDAYDAGGLEIVGEVTCPIRLCLLALPSTRPEQIRRVLSHPVALTQCRRFLSGMRLLEPVSFYDTAGAAREVAGLGERANSAVASERAAAHYGLDIIAASIEDRADNRTRFMIVVASGQRARTLHRVARGQREGSEHVQGVRQRGPRR